MDNQDFHRRLVDLYAGRELPTELETEMETAALRDPELAIDMMSLRGAVDVLRADNEAAFTEESYQRIRQTLLLRGTHFETAAPEPFHLQYQLPIQG